MKKLIAPLIATAIILSAASYQKAATYPAQSNAYGRAAVSTVRAEARAYWARPADTLPVPIWNNPVNNAPLPAREKSATTAPQPVPLAL